MRPTREVFQAAGLAVFISACSTGGDSAGRAIETDSAGISIIVSPGALLDRPVGWSIADVPDVDIGGQEADSAQQLFQVTGASVLATGELVIVNGGHSQLRFFDANGGFLRSVGRRGRGPGSFEFPTLVNAFEHDSLHVMDPFTGTLSILSLDGSYVRGESTGLRARGLAGRLPDGRMITSRNSSSAGPDSKEEQVENQTNFEIVDLALPDNLPIVQLPGPSLFVSNQDGRVAFTTVPFTTAPAVAVGRDFIVVTLATAPELRWYDASGRLVRILRVDVVPRPVRRTEFDSAIDAAVAGARSPEEQVERRRRYTGMIMPATKPVFAGIILDARGFIWARLFGGASDAPRSWLVFDPDGAVRGRIDTPAGLSILQVGSDFVLGGWRDADGVEHIRRHRLVRSP